MKKYILKNINIIVGFSLITIILFLCFAILKKENKARGYSPPISGDQLIDTSINVPIEDTETVVINYKKAMPKPPLSDDTMLFSQDICGIGNICYRALHQTAIGHFIVVDTDCTDGDVAGPRPSVGVCLLDSSGTIKSSFYIPSQSKVDYVCSQITAIGLVVITMDTTKKQYFVNIISYDFENINTLTISLALNIKIIPTTSSFLLIVEYAEETIIYDYAKNKLNFYSIGSFALVEVFEYSTYYLMFGNTQNGYCITKISKLDYKTIEETIIPSSKLIVVKPVVENGVQSYIIIDYSDSLYAKKVGSNLDFGNIACKKLGNFLVQSITFGQNELMIIASGNITGLITLSYDLMLNYSENNHVGVITEILQSMYYKNHYYYLLVQSNELCLMKTNEHSTSFVYLSASTNRANFAINTNDTITLLYAYNFYNYESVKIKGINI